MRKALAKTTISTTTYKYRDGFFVDAVKHDDMWETYVWHKDYGVKDLMFGVDENQVESMDDLLDIIMANVEEYIFIYASQYIDL